MTLMLGRLLSGISAGIFTGSGTVAVIELAPQAWRTRATLVATACNMLGLGCGPLLSGMLVQSLPWPTRLPYAVHLLLVGAAAIGVFTSPETARLPDRVKLRPQQMSLPAAVRGPFVPAALAGFAGFVVVGFFAAVSPQLMRAVLGLSSGIVIGLIVFLLFACSAFGQAIQAAIDARWRLPGRLCRPRRGAALCRCMRAVALGGRAARRDRPRRDGARHQLSGGTRRHHRTLPAEPARRGHFLLFRGALCGRLAASDRPGLCHQDCGSRTRHADLRRVDHRARPGSSSPVVARSAWSSPSGTQPVSEGEFRRDRLAHEQIWRAFKRIPTHPATLCAPARETCASWSDFTPDTPIAPIT